MTNEEHTGLAVIGLVILGAAQMLARPDKTIDLIRGIGWYDQEIADEAVRRHNAERGWEA